MTNTEPLDLDAIESRAACAGSYSTEGAQAVVERFRIARDDVPALIAEVRRLRVDRDEALDRAGAAYASGFYDGKASR